MKTFFMHSFQTAATSRASKVVGLLVFGALLGSGVAAVQKTMAATQPASIARSCPAPADEVTAAHQPQTQEIFVGCSSFLD